ncbi:MAG: urease accessory protein [Betaproteobacteria bacterium]|nr:MAG: urease accessory protein [Betaproteobacteria bacterium]
MLELSLPDAAFTDAAAATNGRWRATLDLRFEQRGERSVLARREHSGPLRILKPLYPEGDRVCHAVIVHPPGGIVGGDSLCTSVQVGEHAHALITTPGTQKWYRSTGATAHSEIHANVFGALEWLPQESMLFDGARVAQSLRFDLSPQARFFGWEILCLGRSARGERFSSGQLHQRIELFRDAQPLWSEHTVLAGDDPLLNSPLGIGGLPVVATAWLATPLAERSDTQDAAWLTSVREVLAAHPMAAASAPAPGLIVMKAVDSSAETVRNLLTAVWSKMRVAAFDTAAQLPRIWST